MSTVTLTPSSSTPWTVPAGVTSIVVTAIGGGGTGESREGFGGGGAGASTSTLSVTPESTIDFGVGSASANTQEGESGGTSYFGSWTYTVSDSTGTNADGVYIAKGMYNNAPYFYCAARDYYIYFVDIDMGIARWAISSTLGGSWIYWKYSSGPGFVGRTKPPEANDWHDDEQTVTAQVALTTRTLYAFGGGNGYGGDPGAGGIAGYGDTTTTGGAGGYSGGPGMGGGGGGAGGSTGNGAIGEDGTEESGGAGGAGGTGDPSGGAGGAGGTSGAAENGVVPGGGGGGAEIGNPGNGANGIIQITYTAGPSANNIPNQVCIF